MRKIIFVISFVMSLFLMTLNVKALSYTDNALKTRKQCTKYELAKANSDGSITHISCHNDYTSAKTAMDTNTERDLIIINEFNNPTRVVDAKYGILYLNRGDVVTYIYPNENCSSDDNYMNNSVNYGGPDAPLLKYSESKNSYRMKISGDIGWVKGSEVTAVVPLAWVKTTAQYQADANHLYHHFAKDIEKNNYTRYVYKLGPKPSMLNPGWYYSYDGNYFYTSLYDMIDDYKVNKFDKSINKDNPYYNYYMYLPHRTRSNYDIDDLDVYFRNRLKFVGSIYGKMNATNYSVLYGEADSYMDGEKKYGANAISMLSVSLNESGRGTSQIARYKNNIFGHAAYDSSPFASATGYLTVSHSIDFHAYSFVNYGYANPNDDRYYGSHFGNKERGFNRKYASDVVWGEKAANHYYDFDLDNGMKDYNYYQLVISTGSQIYARKGPGTNYGVVYTIKYDGLPFVLLEEVHGETVNGSDIWYKLQSDLNIDNNGNRIAGNSSNPPKYNWNGVIYVHSSYFKKINSAPSQNGKYNSPALLQKDIDNFNLTFYGTKSTMDYKVGYLKENKDYYYSSTLANKKGTLLKNSYVTIIKEARNENQVNYLVITNYGTYQKHWINGNNVEIVNRDLLKVNIDNEGGYISSYDKVGGSVNLKIYTNNQLPIIETENINNKLYLKVQIQNEGSVKYGYIDSTISNIKYTLNYVNVKGNKPIINASDTTIYVGSTFNPMDGVTGTDIEDGNITSSIKVVSNAVNTSKKGTYEVSYSLMDKDGNLTTKTIKVTVRQVTNADGLFMFNSLEHKSGNTFTISGFMGIDGMDNKNVTHELIFVNENDKKQYIFKLDNWKDYPYEMHGLDDKKNYDYSGGWFKSDIDLSKDKIPNGDYNLLVRVTNGNYQSTETFTNVAFMDMTRRAKGTGREFAIEVDYLTLHSPLLFQIRDSLISLNVPKTLDPMYNYITNVKYENGLYIKGTSINVNVSYKNNSDVTRYIIFENITTHERHSYKMNNSLGDYLVNLAVPDNCDKKYAWFEVNIPKSEIDTFTKGKYLIYISGTVSNETFYGELEDVAYTDFTTVNKSLGHDIVRNEDLRFRLELNVK